jgi:hypothetical protein
VGKIHALVMFLTETEGDIRVFTHFFHSTSKREFSPGSEIRRVAQLCSFLSLCGNLMMDTLRNRKRIQSMRHPSDQN